jgi:hypothetical protein
LQSTSKASELGLELAWGLGLDMFYELRRCVGQTRASVGHKGLRVYPDGAYWACMDTQKDRFQNMLNLHRVWNGWLSKRLPSRTKTRTRRQSVKLLLQNYMFQPWVKPQLQTQHADIKWEKNCLFGGLFPFYFLIKERRWQCIYYDNHAWVFDTSRFDCAVSFGKASFPVLCAF